MLEMLVWMFPADVIKLVMNPLLKLLTILISTHQKLLITFSLQFDEYLRGIYKEIVEFCKHQRVANIHQPEE